MHPEAKCALGSSDTGNTQSVAPAQVTTPRHNMSWSEVGTGRHSSKDNKQLVALAEVPTPE